MSAVKEIPQTKIVFPEKSFATHMPFWSGNILLFCRSRSTHEKVVPHGGTIFKTIRSNSHLADHLKELPRSTTVKYRPWKLAYCNWLSKASHDIDTGLPDEAIECSPAMYRTDDAVHLSFIAGIPFDKGFQYQLYTMSAKDVGELGSTPPVSCRKAFFGFVSPDHICWGSKARLNLEEKASGKVYLCKNGFSQIVRVTFLAESPSKLLITGQDEQREFHTIQHDLTTRKTSEVVSDGPIYKSTIKGDSVVHAEKKGDGFEDRELVEASYTLVPTSINFALENVNV